MVLFMKEQNHSALDSFSDAIIKKRVQLFTAIAKIGVYLPLDTHLGTTILWIAVGEKGGNLKHLLGKSVMSY